MTRVEEIRQAAQKYSDKLAILCEGGNLFKDFCNGAKWADEHPQFVHTDNSQVIANLEAEIERLKNPWISVKDRLPKELQIVLVQTKSGSCFTALFSNHFFDRSFELKYGTRDGGYTIISYMQAFKKEVTHWMPIPETPKGGEV